MTHPNEHLARALSLKARILGAHDSWLPRRQIVLDWLDSFALRAKARNYRLGESDATDLAELEQFLSNHEVPLVVAA